MCEEAQAHYYGADDTLSSFDSRFWQWKLHFYISGLSFYNFPYSFGYLFALGVYAQRDALGDEFFPRYVALLRDTGSMSCEAVVAKHLGSDVSSQDFWLASIRLVAAKVASYERAVAEACAPSAVRA